MSVSILRRRRVQDAIKDLLETSQGQSSHNRKVTTKRQRNDGTKSRRESRDWKGTEWRHDKVLNSKKISSILSPIVDFPSADFFLTLGPLIYSDPGRSVRAIGTGPGQFVLQHGAKTDTILCDLRIILIAVSSYLGMRAGIRQKDI